MTKIVEVRGLTKKYKQLTAVENLSFSIAQGEILGLLGPNGSGKSTTINCLLSLLNYDAGDVIIFGQKMHANAYDIKKEVGVIFQDVAVFEELTVYENVDYFCGLYISDKTKRQSYVKEALTFVALEEYQKFYPKQLSGGLLRRLNIACGIAHHPKLIFLDEPTVAVDPQSRNNILDGIKKLRDQGATICYTTHYMEEAEILCDRIIIIDKGKIVAQGTKEELKDLANIEEKVTIEVADLAKKHLLAIKKMPHVQEVCYQGCRLLITFEKGTNNITNLLEYFKEHRLVYQRVYSEKPSLNDVFLLLTGKELRD